MKILLYLLIGLHGIIHLFGFLHAFRLYEFAAFTQQITRPWGIVWLVAFLAFGLTLFTSLRGDDHWWAVGLVAVGLSQVLILAHWQDAKFGTIANLLILVVCVLSWQVFAFAQQVRQERVKLRSESKLLVVAPVQDSLPPPVRRWLVRSGAGGLEELQHVYLEQRVKLKLQPTAENWRMATANQYFTVNPPSFNWSVDVAMNPLLRIQGRDQFADGQGSMQMKIWSAFPVVDAQPNAQLNEAALQRFLAEIVWFPAVARSPYIEWEALDEHRARATLTYGGTTGSGIFHFDEAGDFIQFRALRYKDSHPGAERCEWVASVQAHDWMEQVKVPVKLSLTWKLPEGDWTWLELEVTKLQYNREDTSLAAAAYGRKD